MLIVLRSSIDAREEKRRRVNTALKIELPKPRVLLIDDEVLLRRAYARILGDSYDVSMESAAEPALQRFLDGERWDAIICDVRLGQGMDGLQFLQRVLATDVAQARRIMLLTGGAIIEEDEPKLPRGTIMLLKPCAAALLRKEIDHLASERVSQH
jgi:CheY-like chemotaxis protein